MKKWIVFAAVCGLVAFAPTAQASILSPGGTTAVAPIDVSATVAGEAFLGDTGVITLTPVGSPYTVHLETKVYRASGTGWLDFVYSVKNDGPDSLHRVTMFPYYKGAFTDVYYDLSSVPPTYADRNSLLAGTIGFYFLDSPLGLPIGPGDSETLLIRTHDTVYGAALLSTIDGSTATTDSFAPAPLPSSLVLFGTGILAFAGRVARRFRKGWLCLA
jgi:hypothetical protein